MSSKPVPLTTQLQCSHISLYKLPRSFKSLPGNTHFSPEIPPPIALRHTRQVESFWSRNVQWSGIILFREFPLSTGIPSGYSLIPELKDNLLVFWAEGPQKQQIYEISPHPTNLKQQKWKLEWQPFNGLWVSLSESKTNKVYSEKTMTDRDAPSFLTIHQAQIVRQGD